MAQLGRKPNLERRRQAAELRRQGLTLEEIGQRLGGISLCCAPRSVQVVHKEAGSPCF